MSSKDVTFIPNEREIQNSSKVNRNNGHVWPHKNGKSGKSAASIFYSLNVSLPYCINTTRNTFQ